MMSTDTERVVDQQPQNFSFADTNGTSQASSASEKMSENLQPGFNTLQKQKSLDVVQRLDTLEVCLGWTRNNRYCVYSEANEYLFYVYEASVCFHRQLTGAYRGLALKMSLSDQDQDDVLLMRRPTACSSRCCWACCNLQHMELLSPSGSVLATVDEIWSFCEPQYQVKDSSGSILCWIKGGVCHCRCCCQLRFQFVNQDGEEMASIVRKCKGCLELIGAANNFTIHFAETLSVQQKLIVLGSSFLVDLNYFEKQNKCW